MIEAILNRAMRWVLRDAAKKIASAFNDVDLTSHTFSINGGPLLQARGGATRFYSADEIDSAIKRLNEVIRELSG